MSDGTVRDVFFKYSPLIEPIAYMLGKYKKHADTAVLALPQWPNVPVEGEGEGDPPLKTTTEINDVNNLSYVDGFFSFLSGQLLASHGFLNGNGFYGQFLANKSGFIVDLEEDIDTLVASTYFNKNKQRYNLDEVYYRTVEALQSTKHKQPLVFSDEPVAEDLGLAEDISLYRSKAVTTEAGPLVETDTEIPNALFDFKDLCYDIDDYSIHGLKKSDGADAPNPGGNAEFKEHSCSSRTSNTQSGSGSGSDSTRGSGSASTRGSGSESGSGSTRGSESDGSATGSESEQQFPVASLSNFPVNMIALEQCVMTLEQYLLGEPAESQPADRHDELVNILLQIVLTLACYQKCFMFVHNDLHTSNIMYIPTDKQYLYYKYNNVCYKVKTYGKIWKIIDYGRSVYTFKNKVMFSGAFGPEGDAATQYNCEPYLNEQKTIVLPNFSFDLCRLGCSLTDELFSEDDLIELVNGQHECLSPVEQLIYSWCLDDKGRHIMIKKNGAERYPDFKLYKMITRTVHHHTPEAQLGHPLFAAAAVKRKKIKKVTHIMDIDAMPSYFSIE